MDEDLRRGLLSKKGGAFDKLYQEGMVRIQRVKQRNDVIQKQLGTEIQQSIREEVTNQKKFIEKQITELKNLITQMESKFRDPESKTKIKQIKGDAQKQIERNKVILKQLINKSFAARSIGKPHEQENGENYMQQGKIDYASLNNVHRQQQDNSRASMITDNEMEIDYELERKILLEKNQMLNEVEQSTLRINQIMNDMAVMVNDQGQNLDVISEELLKTNQNLVETNKNIEEASNLQKKSKRKYVFLVVLILIIIAAVAGVIFFLTT